MEREFDSIPHMYAEMMLLMSMQGEEEPSRNGPVLTIQEPLLVHVERPWIRVLYDPKRCANPFFHLMEFIWMMAGRNDEKWLSQFNKGMRQYATGGTFHGAYGHRWRRHFSVNQIARVVDMLRREPTDRRAVMAMWDAEVDLDNPTSKDLPCNTHIYFRIVNDALEMTVCNRSNDVVWGMTGANAVHMTFLQELIAQALERPMGAYHVLTNNPHVYTELEGVERLLHTVDPIYGVHQRKKLLQVGETYSSFIEDCERFCDHSWANINNEWLITVAMPVYNTWYTRTLHSTEDIDSPDWALACKKWLLWKAK